MVFFTLVVNRKTRSNSKYHKFVTKYMKTHDNISCMDFPVTISESKTDRLTQQTDLKKYLTFSFLYE